MNCNTKRRIASLLAVPALLFTGACGSDSPNDSAAGVAEVKGRFGDKAEVSVSKNSKPADKTVVKTVSQGSGPEIKKGDFVRMDYSVC
ncbi:hypothetical protein [Streptomyces spiramyceticus]|uniref:hypothetical protein n=1 Tax=Streptomyces spiramyceticus TaxID=299717 RepID=UPI00237A1564|nr:hypothetical protein [Streptomyces spiramyceticus]